MQENAKERDNFNTYLNFFISVKEFKKSNKILAVLLISGKRVSRVECNQFIFVILRIITES